MSKDKFGKFMLRIKILEFLQGFFVAFFFFFVFRSLLPLNKILASASLLLPFIFCIVSSFYEDKLEKLVEKDLMLRMEDVDERLDELCGFKKKWYQKASDNATQTQIGGIVHENEDEASER